MTKSKAQYKSYLLRLWQDADDDSWRARLQNVEDQSVLYFADIETLIGYLLRTPGAAKEPEGDDPCSRSEFTT